MPILDAQVGDEIFLQGDFINVGVNQSGSLGTVAAAPTGFFTDTDNGFLGLGLFADTDGFGVGEEPTFRDATLPGTPVEGFSVGYKTDAATVVLTNKERTDLTQISGEASNNSTAALGQAQWAGTTADGLQVRQTISVAAGDNFIRVDITLVNTSGAAMSDVRYMRNVDPDQAPGFTTDNEVIRQGDGGALIASYVPGGTSPFFYYSADARAVVSNYGFQNNDPYAAAAYDDPQPEGYTATGDTGVNITFGVGYLAPGASTLLTFYMGIADNLDDVINSIIPDIDTNAAPVAIKDSFEFVGGEGSGNVLANDSDPDSDPLTASLTSGPDYGVVTLNPDGSFSYEAADGYTGTDSFTYAASDGELSSSAVVTLTVGDDSGTTLPDCGSVQRAGTQNGSSSESQVLTGPDYHNSFYFDLPAVTGKDRIANFGNNDVIVINGKLVDANGDGIIGFGKDGVLNLDGPASNGDLLTIAGVAALRYLGEACAGISVYADAGVRPFQAVEGTLGSDKLFGDATNSVSDVFFYDTELDLNLGTDRISNFGSQDLLVTTTSLADIDGDGLIGFGGDRVLDLSGGMGGPDDTIASNDGGQISMFNTSGRRITGLEFDGSVEHDGTTYYVYSTANSTVGVNDLTFG